MPFFDPARLARWSKGSWNQEPDDQPSGFSIDARIIERGELFVALRANRDGHDFVGQAAERGAAGALVDHLCPGGTLPQLLVDDTISAFQEIAIAHRKNFDGPVVAVTGSCGKTSTKEALGKMLEGALCTKGNLNNELGVPLTLTRIDPEKHKFAVVEAGINQIGEMSVLQSMIQPDMVIITMIGASHLEGLGSVEGVAEEKIKLWTEARSGALAIFPESCMAYPAFVRATGTNKNFLVLKSGPEPVRGCRSNEAFYELSTETNDTGDSCALKIWRHESPVMQLRLPKVSEGMASNLALAALAASILGVNDNRIFECLPQYSPSALRGSRLHGRGCEYFVDCYNANPASMEDSIAFFRSFSKGRRKLLVLGGMEELGDDGRLLHEKTGSRIVLDSADMVTLVGEKAAWMAPGLLSSGANEEQILVLSDLEAARPVVEDFEGNVLFKGSRSNQLEKLVPSWAIENKQIQDHAEC